MKLDELVRRDSLRLDPADWGCMMMSNLPVPSGVAVLIGGDVLPSGSVHVMFEYKANLLEVITGNWIIKGDDIVRENKWGGGVSMSPTDLVQIEAIINPEDWE